MSSTTRQNVKVKQSEIGLRFQVVNRWMNTLETKVKRRVYGSRHVLLHGRETNNSDGRSNSGK